MKETHRISTVADLYDRTMKDKVRERPCVAFYLTLESGETVEVTDKNIDIYKDLVPKDKKHDNWDEFVHFVM